VGSPDSDFHGSDEVLNSDLRLRRANAGGVLLATSPFHGGSFGTMRLSAWWLATLVVVVGCHSAVGAFSATGYKHPDLAYGVRYWDVPNRALMPDSWQIDNFYVDPGGTLRVKRGAEYEVTRYLDVDGDGKREDLGTVPAYDLRFTNKKNAGAIAITTEPLETKLEERELRVLLGSIVDSIAGGGYQMVQIEGILYAVNNERRYATKIVGEGTATLANQDAYTMVVDVSNVDQLKVDPTNVEVRVMFVLAHTPLVFNTGLKYDLRKFPVVMLVSYSNRPADFDAGLSDFRGLLGRIQIGEASGYVQASPSVAPSASSASSSTSTPDAGTTD
jgi:hypothetical protein